MTTSSQFGEFELDRSRFELRHKCDNSRLVQQEVSQKLACRKLAPALQVQAALRWRLWWARPRG
jgi:hypothetical protein